MPHGLEANPCRCRRLACDAAGAKPPGSGLPKDPREGRASGKDEMVLDSVVSKLGALPDGRQAGLLGFSAAQQPEGVPELRRQIPEDCPFSAALLERKAVVGDTGLGYSS